ncbi:UNVERIFIED_CONTAM: thiol reductase thioredoxin [Euhalothece sp. KZN 001]
MSNLITTTDAQVQDEVSQADQPVLLYFWASWCGPCRLVSPSVEAVAQEYAEEIKVLKLEVDPNPETVKTYQVEGVPALRLVEGDSVQWSHEGAITKDKLKESLDRCLKQ